MCIARVDDGTTENAEAYLFTIAARSPESMRAAIQRRCRSNLAVPAISQKRELGPQP
jgi:hypothetical protein